MAKSRSIGSIYAELSLKDSMSKGLKKASSALGKFAATSAKWAGAGLAAGVTASSVALIAGTKHTLAMTDELADMSAQTGVAIADMMLLQQAYKDGGREASMAGKDIGKMQKALVGAVAGGDDPFSSLGLSAKELINLNPAEQFSRIGEAIMRIQNPAERTAKAMEIFGKGGMGLITVFEGLPAAEKALGRMPELAQRFGAAMGEANDLIGHLPLKSDQFFMGFTAGIIGELLPGLQKIDNYDFTTLGENLGAALATGFEGLLDGTLFTVMSEKFYAAIIGAFGGSDMAAELNADADMLWNELKAKFDANRAAAEAIGASPATSPESSSFTMPSITPTSAAVSPFNVANEVNDYQRRGLSLDGGNSTTAKIEEGTAILREIRDGLKRMAAMPQTASF